MTRQKAYPVEDRLDPACRWLCGDLTGVARIGTLLLAAVLVTACQPVAPSRPPAATQAKTETPSPEEARAALRRWPTHLERTFFVTLHAAGHRTAASGYLQLDRPNAYRIVAVTEVGGVLFDVRYTDGNAVIDRIMPGLPRSIVEDLCRDIALALAPPPIEGLEHGSIHGGQLVVHFKTSGGGPGTGKYAGHAYFVQSTGEAPAHAVLAEEEIEVGGFDKLSVDFSRYDASGCPREILLRRPMRAYTLQMAFTGE
jgi:hypothetical protein